MSEFDHSAEIKCARTALPKFGGGEPYSDKRTALSVSVRIITHQGLAHYRGTHHTEVAKGSALTGTFRLRLATI